MNIKNITKTFIIINTCLVITSASELQKEKSIKTYRKNYTTLVSKWKKEENFDKKKILRQEIERYKEINSHLFDK